MNIAQDFTVDSVDGTYLLHESNKKDNAADDIIGWLCCCYKRQKMRKIHSLVGKGCTDSDAKAWYDYYH